MDTVRSAAVHMSRPHHRRHVSTRRLVSQGRTETAQQGRRPRPATQCTYNYTDRTSVQMCYLNKGLATPNYNTWRTFEVDFM